MRLIDADVAKQIATDYCSNPYEKITTRAVIDKTPTINESKYIYEGKTYCAEELISRLADNGHLYIQYEGNDTFDIVV
jgi:hypothetical protein